MANAEILSIGTELLLGDILDTNAQFIARELAQLGIDSYFRTTVGDNKARIKSALKTALDRSDIVITSGGLGPTADDLTTECIAELFETPLELDQSELERIESFFRQRRYKMPETNRKQALRPLGAGILANPTGTASGICWLVDSAVLARAGVSEPFRERLILTFPGVPSELKSMWKETARDVLRQRYVEGAIWALELKHFGIGESALAEKYEDLLALANPTVAPYAGTGECRLRVAAKAATLEAARNLAEPVVKEIRERSGILCYGRDEDTLEEVVGQLLADKNQTLSVAESCTGGLVSKRLTDISGSSRYVSLNLVTYSNQAKQKLLGVPAEILEKHGAVSPECARAMAEGIRAVSGSDIGVSITGIAGPEGGTAEKPVGLVYLGLSADRFYHARTLNLGDKMRRSDIRFRTASDALNMVRIYLIDRSLLGG